MRLTRSVLLDGIVTSFLERLGCRSLNKLGKSIDEAWFLREDRSNKGLMAHS